MECEPLTSGLLAAQPNHHMHSSQTASKRKPRTHRLHLPSISQADSPCSCLLFFLIKAARARIPSLEAQPWAWMSSFCCAVGVPATLAAGPLSPSGQVSMWAQTGCTQPMCLPTPASPQLPKHPRPCQVPQGLPPSPLPLTASDHVPCLAVWCSAYRPSLMSLF